MSKLIGKKKGMTQVFDKEGRAMACTLIFVEPNVVVQKKTEESDGYDAVQMGAFKVKEKSISKPMLGHFKKANVEPRRYLLETAGTSDMKVGDQIGVEFFAEGDLIDVKGVSKGKGYQGVMKLYGFAGGPAAHGSGFHRHAGSTGMRSTPGICFAGGKRASRMGGDAMTVQNLKVLFVDKEKNLIVVKGAVPGSKDSVVYLTKAIKIKK